MVYHHRWLAAAVAALLAGGLASAQYGIPTDETGNWKVLLSAEGVVSSLSTVPEGPEEKTCLKLTYIFPGQQDEYLLIHAPLPQPLSEDYIALKLTYRTDLQPGVDGPMVFLNEESTANYTIDPQPPTAPDWRTLYLPLSMFRATDFAPDNNGRLDKAEVNELRLARHAALDGKPAAGALWVSEAQFVTEIPQQESYPPRDFILSAENGATGTITRPEEGPEGEAVTRMDFGLPAGGESHAIAVSMLNGERDAVGKTRLRVTYRTALPESVPALIMIVAERGGAGYVSMLPPSPDWTTKEIALANLVRGDWAEDANSQLDNDQIMAFGLGTGGKTAEAVTGTIWVKSYEFVE